MHIVSCQNLRILSHIHNMDIGSLHISCRGVFRTQSNLHVNYFSKKAPSQMFDWILNTPLHYPFAELVASNMLQMFIAETNFEEEN